MSANNVKVEARLVVEADSYEDAAAKVKAALESVGTIEHLQIGTNDNPPPQPPK